MLGLVPDPSTRRQHRSILSIILLLDKTGFKVLSCLNKNPFLNGGTSWVTVL